MARFSLSLEDITHFPKEWQKRYIFKALELNGRNFTQEALDAWQDRPGGDYGKILKVAKLVGEYARPLDPKHVKADEAKSGVYEMRADKDSARLLFFYAEPPEQYSRLEGVVICLNDYWKAKQSKREQERAFETARQLKAMVERNLDALYDACFERKRHRGKKEKR